MATMYKGLFRGRWVPQMSFIRNKHKPNITKPMLPHFRRHVVEHVCTPYFGITKLPDHVPNINACDGGALVLKNYLADQHLDVLAREALEKISNSKFIGFFQLSTQAEDDIFEFKILLKKNGMRYTYCKKVAVTKGLTGTEYEPILQLFQGPTVMATSEEFIQLPTFLKISKKIKKITLMAVMYENRLLSLSEFKYYEQLGSLEAARVNLVHTLNSASQNLHRQINQHPNTLVWCLNQRIDSSKKK